MTTYKSPNFAFLGKHSELLVRHAAASELLARIRTTCEKIEAEKKATKKKARKRKAKSDA